MNLHHRDYGSGKPVIILHGLLGMLDNWHTISRRLATHFHVFAIDQRNHGRSPHTDDFNYSLLVNDLREFMQQHHLPVAHILGHSMGGKTAMEFAVRHPSNVDKLIVVDIAPRRYPRRHDEILKAVVSLDLNLYETRMEIDRALTPRIPDLAVRQLLLKNLLRVDHERYRWKVNLPSIRRHHGELTKGLSRGSSFEKPTLFIRGGRSDYITLDDETEIPKFFPMCRIVTIMNAGHWIHADTPEEFTTIVEEFLLS